MNPITRIILIVIKVFNGLHFYGISAYAYINPEISENCTNGLNDDGDALVDIEDIEDCSLAPRGVNSSSSSTSSSLISNSSSNSTSNHNPQGPTNSSIVFTPQV
jgi:hypothetical protein